MIFDPSVVFWSMLSVVEQRISACVVDWTSDDYDGLLLSRVSMLELGV